jgi:hypothetical protein
MLPTGKLALALAMYINSRPNATATTRYLFLKVETQTLRHQSGSILSHFLGNETNNCGIET